MLITAQPAILVQFKSIIVPNDISMRAPGKDGLDMSKIIAADR